MPYLQVRDFPEDLHEKLKLLAKKEHRSVSQQTILAVEEQVARALDRARDVEVFSGGVVRNRGRNTANIERRKKVFERIKNTPKFEVPDDFPSVTEIIHEGRAERDDRIRL